MFLLAQSGHHDCAEPCPLLGVKRTSVGHFEPPHEFHVERMSSASCRACAYPIRKASGPRRSSSIAAPRWVRVRNASFGAITANVEAALRSAPNSATCAAFMVAMSGFLISPTTSSAKHDTTMTVSQPVARSAFSMLLMPPSMYRSPLIVIAGHTPGIAALEATARSRVAPDEASQT